MKAAAKKIVRIELPAIPPEIISKLKEKGIATLERLSEKKQTAVWNWSRTVVRAYRKILEADPRNVRDISELPFKKDDIKLAIKIALPLYVSKDLQRMVRALKNAYKELGAFQDLEALDAVSLAQDDDQPDLSLKNSSLSIDSVDQNMELIVSEKKALIDEINGFVADLEAIA